MRRDAGGSAAPVRASPAPVQPQKPKTVSRGGSGPAGRREREKNAVERASIAADRGEDGRTFHPGHHSNIRASSAINRAQGEARQAAAWRGRAVPRTKAEARALTPNHEDGQVPGTFKLPAAQASFVRRICGVDKR